MNILILTEGGQKIGFGHITRCLALSEAFKAKGIIAHLIVNGDKTIANVLPGKRHQRFDWLSRQQRLFKLADHADIVIVDSYLADIAFYKKLSAVIGLGVYIDDNNRLDYPKGIVVNGSIFVDRLGYRRRGENLYLLGSQYIPLRKEFWHVRQRQLKHKIKDILIAFGGYDKKGMTKTVLKFLCEKMPAVNKNVIIGSSFQNITEIASLKDKNTNLIYAPAAGAVKEIMLKSDLAISACGQTLYELARVGLPTVAIMVADNQLNNARGWQEAGFIEYLRWQQPQGMLRKIAAQLGKLTSYEERCRCRDMAKRYVDGRGAARVVEKILGSAKSKQKPKYVIATIKSWNIKAARDFIARHPNLNIRLITSRRGLSYRKIKQYNPEYIFFPHWSWKIPEQIYQSFECIVLHMTNLPFGRGGSPLQNLIARGIYKTKISAIKVVDQIDAGSIYLKRNLSLSGSATQAFSRAAKIIFEQMIPYIIKQRPRPRPQQGEVVKFKRRTEKQGNIGRLTSNSSVYDFIRMLDAEGYPPAFMENRNFKIEFFNAKLKKDHLLADIKISMKEKR